MCMNFIEFYEKVQQMKSELTKQELDLEDVKVGYTRATGENIIVAMSSDTNVVSYFKW